MAARVGWVRRPWGSGAGILAAIAVVGCKSPPAPDHAGAAPASPPYAEVARAHNQRVASLGHFYAEGTVTIRLRQPDGKRVHEQGNVDLWREAPDRVAIRIHKAALGEDFIWLGSDALWSWLLDVRDRKAVVAYLTRAARGESFDPSAPITIQPMAMVDLMGLHPLPESEPGVGIGQQPGLAYDRGSDAWTVLTLGRTGLLRLYFDRVTLLVKRVDYAASDGQALVSDLSVEHYQPVELDGQPPGAFPHLPTRIRVRGHDSPDESIRIDLGHWTGRASSADLNNPRVFDLEGLLKRFKPARIVQGEEE